MKNMEKTFCPICSSNQIELIGIKKGILDQRDFTLSGCRECNFIFVQNDRTDFENLYNEDYYNGLGGDPMINYVYESKNFSKTIRNYEWLGVLKIFRQLSVPNGRVLDYGCGVGRLVKFLINQGVEAVGFEEGWAAEYGRATGIPILNNLELDRLAGSFDVITAVEVIEHIANPMEALKKMRALLKPGGILFMTTGNAKPWRKNFLSWPYTNCLDLHVSFFDAENLALALNAAGFQTKKCTAIKGLSDIIKFKTLKTVGVKRRHWLIECLPWNLINKIIDGRYQLSEMPYGIAV